MKFHIHTYGCQMNVRDSEAAEALLVAAGHEKAAGEDDADLVIVNSCTVRQKAEEKAVGKVGNLKHSKRGSIFHLEKSPTSHMLVAFGAHSRNTHPRFVR